MVFPGKDFRKNPTNDDVGYEGIFVKQQEVIAEQLLQNKEELIARVRKEVVPSWVVWQEVDRRIKKLPKAESGNVNDKHMVGFGPYVDVINVDKRIADALRQASRKHSLLKLIYDRVPKRRGFIGLVEAMRV